MSWAVAAFMLVFIGLVYAELAATYPVSGGTARYSFVCFGPLAGFAAGWTSWLQAVTIGPIETEIAITYLEPQWSGLVNSSGRLTEKGVGVAIAFMVFFTLINLAGIRFLAAVNHLAVYWKVAVPLIVVGALAATSFHTSNFYSAGGFSPFGAQGILKAIPLGGVVLALFGFEQAVQVGGEARGPREHLPGAVIWSLLIAAIVYLLLQAAYIGALDPHNLTNAASWLNPIKRVGRCLRPIRRASHFPRSGLGGDIDLYRRSGLTRRKSGVVRGHNVSNYVFNVKGAHLPGRFRTPRQPGRPLVQRCPCHYGRSTYFPAI